jgi:CheY-like chemotaxis protein
LSERRRLRLLVVDDDPATREALCDVLRDEGHEVLEAGDGQQALDWLRAHLAALPDAILLDVMMPVLDGAGFRREQQAEPALATLPVIVVSAAPAGVEGALAVLRKPFDLAVLLAALGRIP